MVEKRIWNSPSPMNTTKIHLHVEQFSLKTNWKLAERLLYNQGYKKNPHIIRMERKKVIKSRPVPWERKGRRYTGRDQT